MYARTSFSPGSHVVKEQWHHTQTPLKSLFWIVNVHYKLKSQMCFYVRNCFYRQVWLLLSPGLEFCVSIDVHYVTEGLHDPIMHYKWNQIESTEQSELLLLRLQKIIGLITQHRCFHLSLLFTSDIYKNVKK